MEEYNLSNPLIKESKRLGMSDPRYYIYASLRGTGFSMKDAWNVAFNGTGANWAKNVIEREMNKLEAKESVQKRIEDIKGMRTADKDDMTPEELAKETSKEKILKDLVIARRRYKEGSKEWTEQTKLIAEYSRIKQDDIQVEDTTIHYHLPVNYPNKCSDCLLFKNGTAEILKK